jgi:hypothetical protein
VEIGRNLSLESISGFSSLGTLRDLNIHNNENLESISGFGSLTNISESFIINREFGLSSISGFKNLKSVGTIDIGPTKIQNLDFFDSLGEVDYLVVSRNEQLTDIGELDDVTINLGILFSYNELLSNFCPLQELITSGYDGDLSFVSNKYNPTYEDFLNGDCSL